MDDEPQLESQKLPCRLWAPLDGAPLAGFRAMRFLVGRLESLKTSQGVWEDGRVCEARIFAFRVARRCRKTAQFPCSASRLEQQKTSRTSRPPVLPSSCESRRPSPRAIPMEAAREVPRGTAGDDT